MVLQYELVCQQNSGRVGMGGRGGGVESTQIPHYTAINGISTPWRKVGLFHAVASNIQYNGISSLVYINKGRT